MALVTLMVAKESKYISELAVHFTVGGTPTHPHAHARMHTYIPLYGCKNQTCISNKSAHTWFKNLFGSQILTLSLKNCVMQDCKAVIRNITQWIFKFTTFTYTCTCIWCKFFVITVINTRHMC